MNPELFIMLLKGAYRIGKSVDTAIAQHARDAAALFPDVELVEKEPIIFVSGFFREPKYRCFVEAAAATEKEVWVRSFPDLFVGDPAPYASLWSTVDNAPNIGANDDALDILYIVAMRILAMEMAALPLLERKVPTDVEGAVAAVMFKQWAEGEGPVSPWVKVSLSVIDVALEYIGTDPSRLGLDGNGGKFLGAFASQLSHLIPDDDEYGEKKGFLGRLGGMFVQAGLRTINENPDLAFGEDHIQELISNTLKPVVESLPSAKDHWSEHISYKKAAEALVGPVARAALMTVSKHQKAFLGKGFDPNAAIGAVTKAVIEEGANIGTAKLFTNESLIAIYQSALGVAAERPEFFIKPGLGDDEEKKTAAVGAARALLAGVARTLRKNPPPFDGDMGVELAVAALDMLKVHALALIDIDDNWEPVVEKLVDQVVGGLKEGFDTQDGEPIQSGLSSIQLGEIAKVFIAQAARNPSMVVGDSEQLKTLVKGMAEGIKADQANLLSVDDWLEIASDAAVHTVADNQEIFLGADFRDDRAGGAVLKALLKTTADQKLKEIASKKSLMVLYNSVLVIAVERPELFLGNGGTDAVDHAALSLFSGVAGTLRNNPPPFNGDLGIELAMVALDTIRVQGPELVDFGGNWEPVIEKLIGQVIVGLAEGLGTDSKGAINTLAANVDLLELGRVFLQQAAISPQMVAGDRKELQQVVKSVASAMAVADNLLLTGDDWKEIARIATEEAAKNPSRLFGLDQGADASSGSEILKLFFTTANQHLASSDKKDKSVLFGATLREAIVILIRATSGRPAEARMNLATVADYVTTLSDFVVINSERFGNKEWLRLFRRLLPHALNGELLASVVSGGELTPTSAYALMA
ncbi:MAG: hypothetical protein O2967_05515 [Proteobacteria bacterium]|nr:hypothetical protein [Pseudomonadota bacterium]